MKKKPLFLTVPLIVSTVPLLAGCGSTKPDISIKEIKGSSQVVRTGSSGSGSHTVTFKVTSPLISPEIKNEDGNIFHITDNDNSIFYLDVYLNNDNGYKIQSFKLSSNTEKLEVCVDGRFYQQYKDGYSYRWESGDNKHQRIAFKKPSNDKQFTVSIDSITYKKDNKELTYSDFEDKTNSCDYYIAIVPEINYARVFFENGFLYGRFFLDMYDDQVTNVKLGDVIVEENTYFTYKFGLNARITFELKKANGTNAHMSFALPKTQDSFVILDVTDETYFNTDKQLKWKCVQIGFTHKAYRIDPESESNFSGIDHELFVGNIGYKNQNDIKKPDYVSKTYTNPDRVEDSILTTLAFGTEGMWVDIGTKDDVTIDTDFYLLINNNWTKLDRFYWTDIPSSAK